MKKEITPDDFIAQWKSKNFPPIKRDKNWETFKWHICKKGEPVNPFLYSKGGEIEVEQFGIIGWLFKVKDKTFPEKNLYFYQCPLIEARETGTGKFGEWLKNVKKFVQEKYHTQFALCTIINQHLYSYCEKYNVPVAVDDILYNVKSKK